MGAAREDDEKVRLFSYRPPVREDQQGSSTREAGLVREEAGLVHGEIEAVRKGDDPEGKVSPGSA